MLLNFIKGGNQEDFLINKYLELISKGVSEKEILVLVQNSTIKKTVQDKITEKINRSSFENLNIHSFFSLVYNSIIDNWCFLQNSNNIKNTFILPNLVGLEVSQYILKQILKEIEVKGYNSKKSLLHQIWRRYSLIIQNDLSEDDVKHRSKILKESFGEDANLIIKKFLSETLNQGSFDYLRQSKIFNYIYKNTDYFKNVKYLLVSDADEMTPFHFKFLSFLKPQLKDYLICFDSLGSSRCGYLSADRSAESKLKKIFGEEIQIPNIETNIKQEENCSIIFENVINNKQIPLNNFQTISLSKRADIIDYTIDQIKQIIDSGTNPDEISIITPVQDDMLKYTILENLNNCTPMFLSGSEKLADNPLVKSALSIWKLSLDIPITEFDLRVVLSKFIGISLKYSKDIIDFYKNNNKLPDLITTNDNEKYSNFIQAYNDFKFSDKKISEKITELFYKTVTLLDKKEINKFNFFIKQLRDFETTFSPNKIKEHSEEIITQIENSIISENPISTLNIQKDNLVIATPQKIIDSKIRTKYQFWLDTSSSEWVKTDTGPLYNAWVFQADWDKEEYTVEDNIFLQKQKTARILRKLMLLAENCIWSCSSLFDTTGIENQGGIDIYLPNNEKTNDSTKPALIVPRDDQKPVLEYNKGTMAISAVPGAGKTTILLALILKLLNNGINPLNIFVLTYMDSAARNFKEKIKNQYPDKTQLPNISTIHGLALRIIKENSNYQRLNLDSDFEICDDSQRLQIIKSIEGKFTKTEVDEFDKAISVMKLQKGHFNTEISDKKVEKFKIFYTQYIQKLRELNLIDYDDILLMSVQLLEENEDILKYYQDICEYIIEDEAQDSSGIQQRLLELLSGKHKNLVRCGDINQAITTTFSNADVEGFRKFIETSSTKVEMNHSQRCSQKIMDLANLTVKWGDKYLPKAFYQSYMQGVEGKNPVQENAILSNIFEKSYEEQNFIIKEIRKILAYDKNATIGILLRNNYQVASWTELINNSGLKSITKGESLGQKTVFNVIYFILQFINNPFDNELLANIYEKFAEYGFYNSRAQLEIKNSDVPFITKLSEDIQSENLSQFLWDMEYWLEISTIPIEELAIKIGLYYFRTEIEKSNVYLIATLIKRLANQNNFQTMLERLNTLAQRPNLNGFKFFTNEDDKNIVKGKVQIMTMHKSKGDEFDYVFIPELTEKSLSLDKAHYTIKSSTLFMEQIRGLNSKYKTKTEDEMKDFSIEESMRLLYVAITRAKKKLYLSVSEKYKSFGRETPSEKSIIFDNIVPAIQKENVL